VVKNEPLVEQNKMMMRKKIAELQAQRLKIDIDLNKEQEYEFFNGEKVT
jgi:hypothetical protein